MYVQDDIPETCVEITERRGIDGSEENYLVYGTISTLENSIISANHTPPLTEEGHIYRHHPDTLNSPPLEGVAIPACHSSKLV